MKICVISTPVFRLPCTGYSGLEHLAWQIAEGLAKKKHDVYLVCPDGSWCPNVKIVPIGEERRVDENMAYGGYSEEKKDNRVTRRKHLGYWQILADMDVIIDHSWNKWSYMLKQEGKLNAPILGVCHAPVNTMFQSPPPVEKPCIVCISQDQADHFFALFNQGVRVAYNGIDLDHYRPTGCPRSERFLFLARFSTIKGPDIAIEACIKAGVGLDLVGDTSITGEPGLLEKCRSMADGKQIRIIGGVSRGETVWWYSQARALLHPNQRFREPFGLAPVEAMACGCPVIAFDYGAMRETVKPGVTGYLVKSVDEFIKMINTKWMRNITQQDRDDIRQHASKFSVERMVNRYEELCTEAIETGGW